MYYLLLNFLRNKDDVDKLTKFYYDNVDILTTLKNRYPDWESYVDKYLSVEVRAELRERGIPL